MSDPKLEYACCPCCGFEGLQEVTEEKDGIGFLTCSECGWSPRDGDGDGESFLEDVMHRVENLLPK